MVGSRVGQTHARMQPMASLLQRAFSRLLESTPNYIEVTAVLAVALIGRLLLLPDIWKTSPQACVCFRVIGLGASPCVLGQGTALHLFRLDTSPSSILVDVCRDWRPSGCTCCHLDDPNCGTVAGHCPPGRLLYGVTVGPIVEEVIFRGAAFSVIYVTASSIGGLANSRIALSIAVSSLLFALAHTTLIGIPWIVFFGMGMLYALLRWRSKSTAAAALMHATYNAVIACVMLRQ